VKNQSLRFTPIDLVLQRVSGYQQKTL